MNGKKNTHQSAMNYSSIPPCYKQTEVGVIPDDWDIITIQDLLDSNAIMEHLDGNHGELYPRNHEFKESGIPYVTANDFCGYKVSFNKCKYLSEERARRFRKGIAKNGDVLFAHNATVGPTALLSTELDYVILSTTATYFRCNPEKLINLFFLYAIQSSCFVHQYRAVMAQSTRNQVPITAQRKLSVILPPTKAEQEAIAEALSDADAFIESLEQLIAKKRHIKQGAMQELLTGKKRLPGFSGKWLARVFNETCWYQEGPGVRSYQFTDSGIKLLNGTNIFRGELNLDSTSRFISEKEAYGAYAHFLADAGDIVIASSGITIERFHEKVAFVKETDLPFCMNTSTIRFKPIDKLLSSDFLYQFLTSDSFKRAIGGQATGSAQLNFGPSHVAKIIISLPSVNEQTAIASILSDMDAEITDLQTKLTKARHIKQGMMHNLLTGKIRLV
ncbi:MAG: restriction endonuclease subunit S [Candidatus Methylumidiphilus sp.]